MGDGIAHLNLGRRLDATDNISHIATSQFSTWHHVHLQNADFIGIILLAGVDECHIVALADAAVDNLEISNDATEGIEDRVEDESL